MESSYANLNIIDSLRLEKGSQSTKAKLEVLYKGSEKQISFDIHDYLSLKCSEMLKSTDLLSKKIIEKPKLRQHLPSRSDTGQGTELKSPAMKKNFDNNLSSSSKVPFLPLLSIRTNALEEIYKEIKEIKCKVNEIEEKNKVNSQCIEMNKVRICDLEERIIKLKQKSGIGCSYEERKEVLNLKLKTLQIN